MANVDRPIGFRPVKTLSGAPVSGMMRQAGVTDGADLFVGDAIVLTSGLVARAASGGVIAGVAVGFGKKDSNLIPGGAFGNPATPETNFYDDSANTHTDWVCYYVPAADVVFEGQTASALTLTPGTPFDITVTAGSQTTGMSGMEITTASNNDIVVIEDPQLVDNDQTGANATCWFKFRLTEYDEIA